MWVVITNGDGICGTFENREDAEKEYAKQKDFYAPADGEEYYGDEHVILARIEKQVYAHDTGKPVIDYDDEGNEIEIEDETYWEFKEEQY